MSQSQIQKNSLETSYNNNKIDEQKEVSILKVFPNLITALGLCFGISSIRLAMSGRFELAVVFLFIAAVLDVFDGGVARILNAQSKFGEVFDSLSDFVNFGFCPIFITYLWNLHSYKFFGWSCVLLCTICMAIRLSRFNSQIILNQSNPVRQKFFFGVPAPASAILVLLPLIISFEFRNFADYLITNKLILVIYIFCVAMLTVSTIPTISLKSLKVKQSLVTPLMLFFAMFVIVLFMEKWKTAIFCTPLYLLSIPFSHYKYKKLNTNYLKYPGLKTNTKV
jgi:CDP-diacylglycerol--serine O-phosphatidyltransferase